MIIKAKIKTLEKDNKERLKTFEKVLALIQFSQNKLIKEGGKIKTYNKGLYFEISFTFTQITPEKTKLFLERLKELER